MPTLYVLNGPNLNLLGTREPGIYGATTLAEIEAVCRSVVQRYGAELEFRQSNHEGTLVDWVHEAIGRADALLINAGAYSHTSLALLDALRAFPGPVIEVHLSNIYRRESFRHHSYVSLAADGVICGFGCRGYALAVEAAVAMLSAAPGDTDKKQR